MATQLDYGTWLRRPRPSPAPACGCLVSQSARLIRADISWFRWQGTLEIGATMLGTDASLPHVATMARRTKLAGVFCSGSSFRPRRCYPAHAQQESGTGLEAH